MAASSDYKVIFLSLTSSSVCSLHKQIQQGWSGSTDLVAFSKRLTAKVRAIRHSSSAVSLAGGGRKTTKSQSATT